MKTLVFGFFGALALAFASADSALAQGTGFTPDQGGSALAQVSTYSATVASPNCVGYNTCLFTFPGVPTVPGVPDVTGLGTEVLVDPWVNCRIVTQEYSPGVLSPLSYAALGKTANAAKLFFLSSAVGPYNVGTGYSTNLINQKTAYFIQAGASPTINIALYGPSTIVFAAPSVLDQPTCSVTGLIK